MVLQYCRWGNSSVVFNWNRLFGAFSCLQIWITHGYLSPKVLEGPSIAGNRKLCRNFFDSAGLLTNYSPFISVVFILRVCVGGEFLKRIGELHLLSFLQIRGTIVILHRGWITFIENYRMIPIIKWNFWKFENSIFLKSYWRFCNFTYFIEKCSRISQLFPYLLKRVYSFRCVILSYTCMLKYHTILIFQIDIANWAIFPPDLSKNPSFLTHFE